MYSNKKDVDNHVRAAFAKLRSDKDRALRGFTIAKLYFKIKEYSTAVQYLCSYLNQKEDNDQAHKMLGHCYQFLKQPSKALQSFQRSLQLNPKQPELLAEVCQMLVDDDQISGNKVKYWCELAESEKVENEAVFALRLKLMNQSNVQSGEIENILRKEISSRPNEVNPRVCLVRHFLDQKRILDAFKYVHEFEMQQNDAFANSCEWYNILWTVLSKYEQMADSKKDWNFWLLVALCLERLVFLSFNSTEPVSGAGYTAAITETANSLFLFDQYLFKIDQLRDKFDIQKELVSLFLEHYRAQLALYAVALIFKRELLQQKNKWRESVQHALPLLLLAFHAEPKENKKPWMKHCDENSVKLVQLWFREGAFRCAQAGRVLLSTINDYDKDNDIEINSYFGKQPGGLWSNADELISQVRKTCIDSHWRRNIFAQLFCNSDQRLKDQTSLFVKSEALAEPTYELPTVAMLQEYEEAAQYLRPYSLPHMIYLHLGYDNLSSVSAKYFNGLNFSTSNLTFCGAESLNQLDVDSYFYAATIQTKRLLEVNRKATDSFSGYNNQNGIGRPLILPFVNMQGDLTKDEHCNWWFIAFKVYKNLLKGDNAAQMRADLQAGIEVVRGQNGPKMDMIIAFKLGRILADRAKDERKPVNHSFLEARTHYIYLHGLKMLKLHNRGALEPFRRTFEYAKSNSSAVEREVNEIAEQAVIYLSERMLKKSKYEDFIDLMNGIPLPFATYKQAEAYRKLFEANATPKSAKQCYTERAADCLQQTLTLLNSTKFDSNHPLNATIHNELKRLQKISKKFNGDDSSDFSFLTDTGNFGESAAHNNSSTYEDAETEFFSPSNLNRSRRDIIATHLTQPTHVTSTHNNEMDALVKRIATTLDLVKDELITTIKPEVVSLRQEIVFLKDKVAQLEDTMNKKQASSEPPSRDDASNMLDDLYMFEDALQNQLYSQQGQQPTSMFPGVANNAAITPAPFGTAGSMPQAQIQPKIQTPNALHMQQQAVAAARAAAYNSPMFNPNYALNYYTSPYMLAQQNAVAAAQRGHLGLPYMEPNVAAPVNMNVPPAAPILPAPPTVDNRTNAGMYNLLNQPQGTFPTLTLPPNSTLSLGQLQNSTTTTMSLTTSTSTPNVTFNKALNNQPVEKGPPANVVITSSDPLPNPNSKSQYQQQNQPILSVTIPPHHIKSSLVQTSEQQVSTSTAQASSVTAVSTFGVNSFGGGSDSASSFSFGGSGLLTKDTTTNFINSFSFKPAVEQALAASKPEPVNLSLTTVAAGTPPKDSSSSDLNRTLDVESAEYDPRPDFQPIIPLPDEIEVRTGEENEKVMFSEHAKLYRFVDKEWKERGVGTLKILQTEDGQSRILMRRDQTHKICANHKITKDLQLKSKPDKNGFIWAAPDFADGEMRSETFYLRFKLQETAKSFSSAFEQAQQSVKYLEASIKEKSHEPTSSTMTKIHQPPFGLTKSNVTSFAASTPTSKSGVPEATTVTTQKPFGLIGACSTAATTSVITTTTTSISKPLFAGLNWSSANSAGSTVSGIPGPKPFANLNFGTVSSTSSMSTTKSTITSVATSSITSYSNFFGNSTQSMASPFSVANLNLPTLTTAQSSVNGSIPSTSITNNTPRTTTVDTTSHNTSNVSDAEDEYVPTAEFKPVIELPELVELTTGEENYIPLFEHRAKLLRFDKDTREWKERGIGNIRILKNKDDPDYVRLVMRREQIHKVCCNQRLYKDIDFKYAKGSKTSLQWVGQDYSEGELNSEMLTIRFKSPETCTEFLETVKNLQAAMTEKAIQIKQQNEAKEEKTNNQITTLTKDKAIKGFGDAFKPKAGSWTCNGCFNSNSADKLYCPSCDAPKDDTVPKKDTSVILLLTNSTNTKFTFGFGNSGQATGSNTNNTIFGNAKTNGGTGFTFGSQLTAPVAPMSTSTTAETKSKTESATKSDFGNKFKPKPGSWTCSDCYTSNTADKNYCAACENPKDSSIPKKDSIVESEGNKNVLALSNPNQKFSFGFTTAATTVKASSSTAAVPATQPAFSLTSTASLPTLSKPTFTFSMQSTAVTSPAMPTDNTTKNPSDTGFKFSAPFSLNKTDFNFSLDTKKSDTEPPTADVKNDANADADDSGLLHEEENNTYFTPVIPLPDKIDVKTGEEDEEVLYQHRAKLYRFIGGEWKERGIGDIKILRHNENKKLRVVMRRDQVHKICLNHVLNEDVEYKRKDEKAWLFVVNDFSEGEVSLEKLSIRFKTSEIADDFMNAVTKALSKSNDSTPSNVNGQTTESKGEKKWTTETTKETEEKQTEKKVEPKWSLEQPELKLPQSSNKKDHTAKVTTASNENLTSPKLTTTTTATAAKSTTPTTPANRSFLLKQSALTAPATPKENKSENETNKNSPAAANFSFTAALKESESSKSPAVSGGFLFGNSGTNNSTASAFGSSIFGGGIANSNQPVFGQSASIFSNNANVIPKDGNQTSSAATESKSIFGTTIKPVFGSTMGGSLFGNAASSTNLNTKSNLFGSVSDGSSLFNSNNTNNTQNTTESNINSTIFSGSSNTNITSTTNTPIFGATPTFDAVAANKNTPSFGSSTTATITSTTESKSETTSAMSTFNFAELSSKSGGLDFASIAAASNNNNNNNNVLRANRNPGAAGGFVGLTNQDAFSSFRNRNDGNGNNDVDGKLDTDGNSVVNDENYDPHYEPIIPLPQEIVVSTGEEDEDRLFSERATLFRQDATNKEWKERGVGDLKILKHRSRNRYRLVLRREQVHKLVLNFPISADSKFDSMKNNPKSVIFIGMNYAESNAGDYERLAVRFGKIELANQFSAELKRCMEQIQPNEAA